MAASVQLSPLPKQRFVDTTTGLALVGGKVFTYAAGTTTKQATYTDSTGATQNTNPVVLDARGEASIWLDQTLTYKVILAPSTDTDPPTNPIWTVDNLPASAALLQSLASSANGSGADMVGGVGRVVNTISALRSLIKTGAGRAFVLGYYAPGDGGGGQYYYDSTDTTSSDNGGTVIIATDGGRWKLAVFFSVSVKQFGAKGDNAAIDTVPIQAAITWVQNQTLPETYASKTPSLGPVELFAPAGYYLVDAPLVITHPISIRGDGTAEFSKGSRLVKTTYGDLFTIVPVATGTSTSFTDLTMTATLGGGSGGDLVNFTLNGTAASNSNRFVRCCFTQPQHYAVTIRGDDTSFTDCLFDVSTGGTGDSIQLGTNTAGELASNVRFVNCNWFNVATRCVLAWRYRDVSFVNCQVTQPIGGTGTLYFFDAGNTSAPQAQGLKIVGCTFEYVKTMAYLSANCSDNVIASNVGFGNTNTVDNWIYNFGAADLTLTGNRLSGSFTGTTSFYGEGAVCSNLNIQGNSAKNTASASSPIFFNAGTTSAGSLIRGNLFTGWANQVVGDKRASSGSYFAPGTVGASSSINANKTVIGARLGDRVDITPVANTWPSVTGVEIRAYVSNTDTITVQYRNYTGAGIAVAAHDLVVEVSR